ncbi:hypothetical protein B0H16DRAFT_1816201 [Mycena metata]|uniref:F-box domain-containing protein n=1 Tax=Mycena metata TaxID=1033252 RepID=A0AAD7JAF5_9AGAR|nr:hypothetical protein B0H16DRAFT_1816201 [Mycena metata]
MSVKSMAPLQLTHMQQTLPSELTDSLIDLISIQNGPRKAVRSDLAACALVCRAWSARSRFHLFRLFLAFRLTKYNLTTFTTLIRSEHCTIVPYVQELTLYKNGGYVYQFDEISDVLEKVTAVKRLRMTGDTWEVHGAAPRRGFMKSLPHVTHLEVDCANLGDFDHALQIFCAFPAPLHLSVQNFNVGEAGSWRAKPPIPYAPAPYLPAASICWVPLQGH